MPVLRTLSQGLAQSREASTAASQRKSRVIHGVSLEMLDLTSMHSPRFRPTDLVH